MLTEGRGQGRREFQLGEVVTICDHLLLLFVGEAEHEVGGKAARVAFDRLIQGLRRNIIKLRQVRVQHDPLAAN